MQKWLTYAETNCGPNATKANDDCHGPGGAHYCTTLAYFDANVVWDDNPLKTASGMAESWWLHAADAGAPALANRLVGTDPAFGSAYFFDQDSDAGDGWVVDYIRTSFASWDGLMMDDTGACPSCHFYAADGHPSSSLEISTTAGILGEHEKLAGLLTHPDGTPYIQVDNGIQGNSYLPNSVPLLNKPGTVVGLVAESQPWNGGMTTYYPGLLDEIAAVDHLQSGDFIALLSYDASGSLQARRVQAATVLLGYAPTHVVSWADLEQNSSDLAVWPEAGIYPSNAIQSMGAPGGTGCFQGTGAFCSSGGHNDIMVAAGTDSLGPSDGGVFVREFRDCYDQGTAFGACAALVNDSKAAVIVNAAWLAQTYHHQTTMVGGDVQSGGTLDLQGATFTVGTTAIPAYDAFLLSP